MRAVAHYTTRSAAAVAAAAGGGGFWRWNSPICYIFGGLAVMLGLIAVALVVLACSYRKSLRNMSSSSQYDEEKPPKVAVVADFEPKIVVIMAGDERPTYLANPLSLATCHCHTTTTTTTTTPTTS